MKCIIKWECICGRSYNDSAECAKHMKSCRLAMKKMANVREAPTCDVCKHARRGAGVCVLTHEYPSMSRTCDWFERKEQS